jgi:hypothetical protein
MVVPEATKLETCLISLVSWVLSTGVLKTGADYRHGQHRNGGATHRNGPIEMILIATRPNIINAIHPSGSLVKLFLRQTGGFFEHLQQTR